MSLSTTRKLQQLLAQFSGSDHVLILINADPDSIASAMAFQRLLWRRVTRITVSNINTITRPDNMAMIRLLDVTLIHVTKIAPQDYTKVIILDSEPSHHESFREFRYAVIIDHHDPDNVEASFKDIRPEYGATSSIMTEYLKTAKIKPSSKLATALFHGIKTDTNNFERMATNADIRAFQFLFRHANIHLARRIEQVDLRMNFLEYFKQAIEHKVINEDRVFVHLGQVETPDICVLIADFFMRVNTVTWSIVSGFNQGRLIIILRNDGLRKDAGSVASKQFGELGTAGGHKSMARAEIPAETLKNHIGNPDKQVVQEWIINRISSFFSREAQDE
ncbi:MAG: DHH family phosphoesterase [Desulfobacteraceae bacterium]|nr:DHH family phosphoesterase [Desulfobacteraceae bacterium]MCF8094015.1 DHH family phosphoesterase [Desulfobacteraceae bacterium]